MKIGFSECNFPHRDVYENLAFAAEHGFDFLEIYGPHMDACIAEDGGVRLAAIARERGVEITVHHALVDPEDGGKVANFRRSVQGIYDWYARVAPPLADLSFDTWVDRKRSLPQLLEVLALFRGTGLWILTEDFPLNEKDALLWKEACRYENYGLLSDLGHTNVRLCDTGAQEVWCLWNEGEGAPLSPGVNSAEAFRNALLRKPLPVKQLHLHNNDGRKDAHESLLKGSADFAAIAGVLRDIGFDGYADLELSPTIHGIYGKEADELLLGDLAFWREAIG